MGDFKSTEKSGLWGWMLGKISASLNGMLGSVERGEYRIGDLFEKIQTNKRKYMNKPKVFVSSTIYDFKDLRSVLKYWLIEKGYEVRMSERNDFRKDSSQNSYQACLDSIGECDYFILLIGSRAGGICSQNPLITIT